MLRTEESFINDSDVTPVLYVIRDIMSRSHIITDGVQMFTLSATEKTLERTLILVIFQ